jgi:hypothetical protein
MTQPQVRRDGDVWSLAWDEQGVAIGMERLTDTRDGLRAEVTVESAIGGRTLGPVWLNILSTQSQTSFANTCAKRVNSLDDKVWLALVVHACGLVAKQYRAPRPVVDLSLVEAGGETEYLIPGLLPLDETSVVYGDGESAKSLLVMRIAISVITVQELPWGVRPTRQGNVLYLDWETNERTVANRLGRLSAGMAASVPQVFYRQCFRSLRDELPSIREEISRKQIDMVVTDSIGFAASGALVEDETARAAMGDLRLMSPATRLVVAHVSANAAQQTTGTVRPFGSAFFWNAMRSGLEVRRSEEGSDPDDIELAMYQRKSNDGAHHKPIGMNVMFDGKRGPIVFNESDVNDTPDLAARTSLSSRLRAMLKKGSRSTVELSEEFDTPVDTISKTLRRMPDVVRVVDGGAGGRSNSAVWGLGGGD